MNIYSINTINNKQKSENDYFFELYKSSICMYIDKHFNELKNEDSIHDFLIQKIKTTKNKKQLEENSELYNKINSFTNLNYKNNLNHLRIKQLIKIECINEFNILNDKIKNFNINNTENILNEINIFNENKKCENENIFKQLHEEYNKRFEILQSDNYNIILTSMNEDKNIDNFIEKGHWYNEIFQQREKKWLTIEQANELDNIRNNRLQQINEKCTEIYNELNDKIINSDLENIENILDEINIFNKNQKCENEHVYIQLYKTYNKRFKILQSDNYNIILTSMNEDKNIDNFIEKGYWYNEIFQQEEKKWLIIEQANELDNIRNNKLKLHRKRKLSLDENCSRKKYKYETDNLKIRQKKIFKSNNKKQDEIAELTDIINIYKEIIKDQLSENDISELITQLIDIYNIIKENERKIFINNIYETLILNKSQGRYNNLITKIIINWKYCNFFNILSIINNKTEKVNKNRPGGIENFVNEYIKTLEDFIVIDEKSIKQKIFNYYNNIETKQKIQFLDTLYKKLVLNINIDNYHKDIINIIDHFFKEYKNIDIIDNISKTRIPANEQVNILPENFPKPSTNYQDKGGFWGILPDLEIIYNEENIKTILSDYKKTLNLNLNNDFENNINILYDLLINLFYTYNTDAEKNIFLTKIWNYLVKRKIDIDNDFDLIQINNLNFNV